MPIATLRELVEAGVHFGATAARWNPKMKPYIHSKQNKIHIINLKETLRGLVRSYHFLKKVTAEGKKVLFVGTKRQVQDAIRLEAVRSESFFVCNRWLGGTLTNMDTMRKRVLRLKELEELDRSGELHDFSKKMISSLTRERKKIYRNFEGIRDMDRLPGALVVVDPSNEPIAVAEAVKLGIPVVALLDTDCDPDPIDFIVPANDDAFRSVQYLLGKLSDAVVAGRKQAATNAITAQRAGKAAKVKEEEDAGIDTPEDFTKVSGFSYGGEGDSE